MRCADGLVLGADSQITDADRGLSYPARKLHRLGDHAAWGGSGARAAEVIGAERGDEPGKGNRGKGKRAKPGARGKGPETGWDKMSTS